MPKFSRKTSHVEERQPFGVYDGPTPPRGNYPGVVKQVQLRDAKAPSVNQYFNVLVELDSPDDSPKAQYNGFAAWTMITLTDQDANVQREQAFYRAICGQADVDIVLDDEKPSPGVTRIGGKNPVGVAVRVDLRPDTYNGETSMKGDSIYPGDAGAKLAAREKESAPAADPDADLKPATAVRRGRKATAAKTEPEAEESSVEAETPPERHLSAVADTGAEDASDDVDFQSLNLPKLRAYAKEKGIDTAGKSKSDLIDALTDLATPPDGDSEAPVYKADVLAMNDAELEKFVVAADYEWSDFDGMDREETADLLIEDGIIEEKSPF